MAERWSVQTALELISKEREIFDDDVEGEDSEEEVLEFEHYIAEYSESDSDSEENDEVEHQPVPKRKRATGPGQPSSRTRQLACRKRGNIDVKEFQNKMVFSPKKRATPQGYPCDKHATRVSTDGNYQHTRHQIFLCAFHARFYPENCS
ncbi:unnamed protein product [Anisakis simplex]|uniref:Vacuolar protein sorting-associated protein 72 homolog n=1 Tax=Anisakis simplex TaxID=6269 RepID=A0A0M3JSN9_ANISI|nr:unnamed protein product [Anisakis simplex]